MNYEEQVMQEEANYWFTLNDITDYVIMYGSTKVFKDIFELIEQRKDIERRKTIDQCFADVPF